jgi:hypothetical protein
MGALPSQGGNLMKGSGANGEIRRACFFAIPFSGEEQAQSFRDLWPAPSAELTAKLVS